VTKTKETDMATTTPFRIIEDTSADWAVIVDTETGEMLDQGHVDSIREHALERLGVQVDQTMSESFMGQADRRGRFPQGTRFEGTEVVS
jgi:hypothetical protein